MASTPETGPAPKSSTQNLSVPKRDDSRYLATNLTMMTLVPMTVKAFIDLGIPDILANGKEPMSAEEIVAKLPTKSGSRGSASNLARLLRPLVREGVVSESLNDESKPVYGLTEVSRWYRSANESTDEFTALHFARLQYSTYFMSLWPHFKEVILDDTAVPFDVEYGTPFLEYIQKDSELRDVFQEGMLGLSKLQLREVVNHLQHSGVLEGVQTLVDIGGGQFATIVGHIVAKNPHIRGINLDLPNVIATVPPVKGVENVAGDFFKSVPSGDAIFMKLIIHGFGDEDAIQILKNCFEALPKNGKVILAEYVLNDGENEQSPTGRFAEFLDLCLLACVKKGKERTKEDHQKLLEAAGFSHVSLIASPGAMSLVQAIKV